MSSGGRLETRNESQLHVLVQADRGVVHAALRQVRERDRSVRFVVDVETQRAVVQVKQHADHRADRDAAVDAIRVLPIMHEPRALRVDVHTPRLRIFA